MCYHLFLKVFSNAADTGVPDLIEHVRTITGVRRRDSMEHLIRSVTRFVLDIAGYLEDVRNQVGSPPFHMLAMSDEF